MNALNEGSNYAYTPVHNGTLSGLTGRMDEWSIDASVILPVVTKATQVIKSNEWAASVSSNRIISFGGIYPHAEDYKAAIDFVASLGLKGLKFHAEYQDFIADDARMLRIYDYALSKGLIIVHHAGEDPAFKAPFRSNPKRFLNIVNALPGGVIVASHFGGHAQWDDVEKYLAGSGIYLDTSMGFEYFSREQFLRIVEKHGADKILFASDSPWSNAGTELEHLKSMPLPEADIKKILGGNAERILKLT